MNDDEFAESLLPEVAEEITPDEVPSPEDQEEFLELQSEITLSTTAQETIEKALEKNGFFALDEHEQAAYKALNAASEAFLAALQSKCHALVDEIIEDMRQKLDVKK